MQTLDASTIISIWEEGRDLDPIHQGLLILQTALDPAENELSRMPIGVRDAWLYRIRRETFGTRFDAFVRCPVCGAALEFDCSVHAESIFNDAMSTPRSSVEVEWGGASLTIRPPAMADVIHAMNAVDEADQQRALIEACVASKDVAVGDLVYDLEALNRIEAALLEADPASDILMHLSCPDCTHQWSAAFDIITFLWNDIEMAARSLLNSVHLIASHYGWDESRILRLSPHRRQFYLERILA